MADTDRERYLEAYYDNEADANKQMSLANAAAAAYMLVIWIFYLTGFFKVFSTVTMILINVLFPVGILVLLTPITVVNSSSEASRMRFTERKCLIKRSRVRGPIPLISSSSEAT